LIRAQGRVFSRACSRRTQEDRRCDRATCQQKHRFLPRIHDGDACQHNENTQTFDAQGDLRHQPIALRPVGGGGSHVLKQFLTALKKVH